MTFMDSTTLRSARDLTTWAAQWLELIGFQALKGGVTFSPSLTLYHDMLDPSASDAAKLEACRAIRSQVLRRVPLEEIAGEEKYLQDRPNDPYRAHWKITREGAVLNMIAHILSAGIQRFEAEMQEPGQ